MRNPFNPSSKYGYLALLGLTALVLLADILTKQYFHNNFYVGQRQPLLPFLSFSLHYNPGAAFSFLASAGGWQKYFFMSVSVAATVAFTVWLYRLRRPEERWLALGLSMIIAGAIGNNLHDRPRWGKVVDFISVHWQGWYFPTFNVADIAISIGAILVIVDGVFLEPKRRLPER